MSTKIEWTNETWNPIIGCSKISEGCKNCYAEKMANRLAGIRATEDSYCEVVNFNMKDFGKWNGKTHFVESTLQKPLKWKKPRKIFICSMGDLFHKSVPFEWIDKVMAVIARSKQHTFQVLTKRPERMEEYFLNPDRKRLIHNSNCDIGKPVNHFDWPIPNLHLGVSVENQEQTKRISILLKIPAKVKFVSVEPMLGPIDLSIYMATGWNKPPYDDIINWVICGGETGPNARPIKREWVEDLQQQCENSNVPFFFKSWGGKDKNNSLIGGIEFKEFPKV